MSHHGGGIPESMLNNWLGKAEEKIEKLEKQFGATGRFPDGKLNENDEGEIAIGIAKHEDRVILNFGDNPIKWIGFTKQQAVLIGKALIEKAME